MGIAGCVARALIKELKYQPIPETVHLLGRQTIHFDYEFAVNLIKSEGLVPQEVEPGIDQSTLTGKFRREMLGKNDIDDFTFFKMLGAKYIKAIDHCDYEGADVIVDLTRPVQEEHHAIADFIFDGSVMDNIFDPATAFKNVAAMLKPHGRYFGSNMVSNKLGSYAAFSPQYFFDYFAINKFEDAKIYVQDFYRDVNHDARGSVDGEFTVAHVYRFHPGSERSHILGYTGSSGVVGAIIIAEKGVESTFDQIPLQSCYRSDEQWEIFNHQCNRIDMGPRPTQTFGRPLGAKPVMAPGYEYVGSVISNGHYHSVYDPNDVSEPEPLASISASIGPLDHQAESLRYHLRAGLKDMDPNFLPIYESCRQYSMTSAERMYALYQAIHYIAKSDILGDIVECGVWRGGSMMVAAKTLMRLKQCDRKLYLYDTFEGLPKPQDEIDVDMWDQRAIDGWLPKRDSDTSSSWARADLEEVRVNLLATGYPPENIVFVKGMVEDTIPSQIPESIALLRLDTDWYQSTKHEMNHLFPLLEQNGIVIFDDYGHFKGARKAVDEYIAEHKLPILLNRIDYSGRMAIKTFSSKLAAAQLSR